MEATGGFEPPNKGFADPRLNHLATSPLLVTKIRDFRGNHIHLEPEDEIRTSDSLLGKEMLYR